MSGDGPRLRGIDALCRDDRASGASAFGRSGGLPSEVSTEVREQSGDRPRPTTGSPASKSVQNG